MHQQEGKVTETSQLKSSSGKGLNYSVEKLLFKSEKDNQVNSATSILPDSPSKCSTTNFLHSNHFTLSNNFDFISQTFWLQKILSAQHQQQQQLKSFGSTVSMGKDE